MPRIAVAIAFIILLYAIVVINCTWVYKSYEMSPQEAFLFSVDTICSRGRMDEPKVPKDRPAVKPGALAGRKPEELIHEIRWWAIAETLFGHLGLPLAIALFFRER